MKQEEIFTAEMVREIARIAIINFRTSAEVESEFQALMDKIKCAADSGERCINQKLPFQFSERSRVLTDVLRQRLTALGFGSEVNYDHFSAESYLRVVW